MLITAGPTREHLDPVRFMTNASSGAMGYALARAARERGASVTVVSGPCSAPRPPRVSVVPVVTALEMRRAVLSRWRRADLIIGAAAVGDWRFARPSRQKVKRSAASLALRLVPNPDIIAEVARRSRRDAGRRRVIVGFALETSRWLERAREKLRRKDLDLIVANREAALGAARSRVALVARGGAARVLPRADKARVAGWVLEAVQGLW